MKLLALLTVYVITITEAYWYKIVFAGAATHTNPTPYNGTTKDSWKLKSVVPGSKTADFDFRLTSVSSESCTIGANCTVTICADGSVICQHPDDGSGIVENGGLCTCAAVESSCVYAQDCYLPSHPELNCENNDRHCYDGKCICDRFGISDR